VANLNITNIPAPRVPFIDERTGLMAREWYRFFLNLFVLTGSGGNPTTLDDLQIGPPNQPDLAELLIQINQNIAPQYEDQSGDFLATLDAAQLMSMMARFDNAEAAIQGAYLNPIVQTGTIANYNLDGSPTLGGVVYGTGPALAVSAAGTVGQVLTSAGAATPTWATPTTGTVSSVSVVSANGLAGTVATATTTPAITLSTTITGLLKGNGTAISAAASGTDYAPATSGASILYGNGAGGFSNVTIGTGVSFAAGTLSATGSGGTVTSVTGTAPVVSSGGATPAISMPAATTSVNGYLTSTDWNTFNNKGSGSVTSVSFTGGVITVATATSTPALTVAGTSGGIPYFSSASTWATSAALAAGALVQGGGAGVAPATITTGTGVVTALGVNIGSAGAFVTFNGAGGTPSSMTATNLTGTAAGLSIGGNAATATSATTAGTATNVAVGGITGLGTGVGTALAIAVGSAGGPVTNGGALGTPSSGTVTNLTGTGSININGTVGATTANTGAFTTITATSIKFGSGAVLSSYEEGTFTPTLIGDVTNPTVTYSLQRGVYTKVGRVVTVSCYLAWSAISGGSGNIAFGGLPYTIEGAVGASCAGSIAFFDGFTLSAARTSVGLLGASNTTYSLPTCFGSAVSSQYIGVGSVAASGTVVYTLTYSI